MENQMALMSKVSKCQKLARKIHEEDEYVMMGPFTDSIQDQYRLLVKMLLELDLNNSN